ncbi:MAG: glycosyltransferase family 4 protein [Syntrophaceae bacterium]
MRIAFLIYGSVEMNSGGFLYDRKVVEHLRAHGDHVRVISLPWIDYARSILEYGNIAAEVIPELERDKPDLLLQDELAHPLLSLLNRRMRKLNIPVVSIVHHLRCSEEQPLREKLRAAVFEALYLTGVDGFVFNSSSTLESVRKLRVASGKSYIISPPGCDRFRNGFDPDMVRDKSTGPGPLKIVFGANIIPRKGLHTLIAALKQMPAGSWRLAVAGDAGFNPAYAAGIRKSVREGNLAGYVDFLGPLKEGLADVLQDSHVLAVPSSCEGYGMIYAEAMGFGLPAIGCPCGAVPQIIEHGRNGFLIMPGDHEGLARHLLALHNDRNMLREMSMAARGSFLALPRWEEGLGRISGFLQKFT